MNNALILYDSLFGHIKKIALALSRGLEAGGFCVECIPIQDFKITEFQYYNIIGFGCPTISNGISKTMISFLTKIKHYDMKDKYGFAFETKRKHYLSGSAGKKIVKYLKTMNLKIIYPIITGFIINKERTLCDGTLNNMERIGIDISERLNNNMI
ncbi:MAG: flavodoxin domain-containing protein [Candidatus Helarchaeota archaeon]